MHARILLALPCFLLLQVHPAMAQLYKWVDANGTVRYSDQAPPANTKPKVLDIPRSPAPAEPTPTTGGQVQNSPSSLQEKDAAIRNRLAEKRAAEEREEKFRQAKRATCERAKEQVTRAENVPLIRNQHENNTVARAADIYRARSNANTACQ